VDRNDATRAFAKFVRRMPNAASRPGIPHHTDAQAYDIVYLLKQAMENRVTDVRRARQERTAIRDALRASATGVTSENTCFNADRDAQPRLHRDQDLKWNLFDPGCGRLSIAATVRAVTGP
jgi:hypothetical protein